jgi:hypothetical protein
MFKQKMVSIFSDQRTILKLRLVLVLTVLIMSLLFTGIAGAGPTAGGVGT